MRKAFAMRSEFVTEVQNIIETARAQAIRSVDFQRVLMYWEIGRSIQEEEQQGQERADYGSFLIHNLSHRLMPEYGSGFSVRLLELSRQFYRVYPNANTLCSQLNWSQYRLLIALEDSDQRVFYEHEAVKNGWSKRLLERQIHAALYERLLLSNSKEDVLAVARSERLPEAPREIIKDPMVLEFLGLERRPGYYEKDLEAAIIVHLHEFLLELGNGFSFVARQKRILLEDDEFFVDLVFYNRLLRCFVLFEIKTRKLTHQDIGQLQMYVNYFDRVEKLPEENATIGVLMCAAKNDLVVKFSLPEENTTIMASQYQLYLPSESQLLSALKQELREFSGSAPTGMGVSDGE